MSLIKSEALEVNNPGTEWVGLLRKCLSWAACRTGAQTISDGAVPRRCRQQIWHEHLPAMRLCAALLDDLIRTSCLLSSSVAEWVRFGFDVCDFGRNLLHTWKPGLEWQLKWILKTLIGQPYQELSRCLFPGLSPPKSRSLSFSKGSTLKKHLLISWYANRHTHTHTDTHHRRACVAQLQFWWNGNSFPLNGVKHSLAKQF